MIWAAWLQKEDSRQAKYAKINFQLDSEKVQSYCLLISSLVEASGQNKSLQHTFAYLLLY